MCRSRTPATVRHFTVFPRALSADSRTPPGTQSSSSTQSALLDACRAVLTPLARLAIARGLHHSDLDELLRAAFVEAALDAHPDVTPHRAVSRVSTTTGLHRREVNRLLQREPVTGAKPTAATQLFTRWLSDPAWRKHASLPRLGAQNSFEALAQSVTKDVHPRSLLEELCRLGLARIDEASDRVELIKERFAPAGDEPRMLGFVASNVGDHLRAAVTNVLADTPPHLEQAVFADGLSPDSLQELQPLIREQWQHLLRTLAPMLQNAIDKDAAEGRAQDQRVRVGLYAFHAPMTESSRADVGSGEDHHKAPRRAARKTGSKETK
ncbi:DUF6502 family protein [Piscinibacter sp. HJYY11]|uniref:DUF6502 family protein n=1 Tax=Piscinibacter sp. HJYY11 TaxID=2801333 RepID=UPI00191D02E9|nr:DUF6502 family protein [Piscinibacter sp. HJYY11]MBL0726477.1 hypothetical protein [Piscinibacter sp. HJYY11]